MTLRELFACLAAAGLALCPTVCSAQETVAPPTFPKQVRIIIASVPGAGPDFTGAQRMQQFPQVPTIAESGLAGYDHEQWYALFAPAKTPPAIVQALHREATRIANVPEINERLVATGHRVVAGTPQQLVEKQKREIEKTRQIIQASGMQQH